MSEWQADQDDHGLRGTAPARRSGLLGTPLYVLMSLVFALVFGTSADLFRRAWGDPDVQGIWVSIGSVLFILWVIAVTAYAVLRIVLFVG
ncbi:MAG: hypothetical protein WBA67_15240, partial [Jannaschia sp.]